MKRVLLLLAFLPFALHGQTINTIVGNGSLAYPGDGTAATAAGVYNPSGVAYDHAGNLYVSASDNHCIRKVTPAGIITTVAGTGSAGYGGDGGPATNAQLNRPIKIYIDGADNLFISDMANHRVRKVTPAGIITTVAGTGALGFSGDGGMATNARLYNPSGVGFDLAGNMYIADYTNQRIRKVNTAGYISTCVGNGYGIYAGDGGPATAASINGAFGVAVTPNGELYIADAGNDVVRYVNASGIISTFAGTGSGAFSGDGGLATAADLHNPAGVCIDGTGTVYIADQFNMRIRKVVGGIITTIAGDGTYGFSGDGGSATLAQLSNTNEITVSPAGDVVICDDANYRVRMINMTCPDGFGSNPLNDTVTAGADGTFYVTVPYAGATYQWQQGVGGVYTNIVNILPYAGATSDTLTIVGATTVYDSTYYRCVISLGANCTGTSAAAILRVKAADTCTCSNLAVSAAKLARVTVYPNPAQDYVEINVPGNDRCTATLYNQLGQLVRTQDAISGAHRLDIKTLPAGIYLLKLRIGDGVDYRRIQKY